MVAQTDPEAVVFHKPVMKASPDGRLRTCPPVEASGPRRGLIPGLALGAVLWLAIGVFAWQFFR